MLSDVIASAVIVLLLGSCGEVSSWVLPPSPSIVKIRKRTARDYYSRSIALAAEKSSRPGIFFEDELECPDEEGCEIDWSSMPGFGDDEETAAAVESHSTAIVNSDDPDCPEEEECEIDWSSMPGFGDDNDEDETAEENAIPSANAQNSDTSSSSMKYTTQEVKYDDRDDEINEKLDELEPQEAYVRQVKRSIEQSRTHMEMNWQIEDCVVDEDTCVDACSDCGGSGKVHCMFCRGTGIIAFGDEFRSCILCKGGLTDCKACTGTGSIASWAKTHDGSS
uniref:Uncharacterized protein n=1 Tax=Pseudo-nitzschia australis TaxID=44445 RepID=A0A7S4AQY5_9STRA